MQTASLLDICSSKFQSIHSKSILLMKKVQIIREPNYNIESTEICRPVNWSRSSFVAE